MVTEVTTGSYWEPLAAGLRELNEAELARQVEERVLKMGRVYHMCSNDQPKPEITPKCIMALCTKAAQEKAAPHVLQHYTTLLVSGKSMMAIAGGLLATGGDQEYYRPGELF